ncbi:hypothetical protein JZ751_025395 [Albula glossodonta]|uniref:Golgi integral membrane protein 4 n=1 Tax=Albula glossodonta TaxID=121402 RepID=A0A8T2NG64_9TELE|nr:hypothetical protein JZ751_025395 [Albula glossodonta]
MYLSALLFWPCTGPLHAATHGLDFASLTWELAAGRRPLPERVQVEEYKQLKETLNKMPSLRKAGQDHVPAPPQAAVQRADHAQTQPRVRFANPIISYQLNMGWTPSCGVRELSMPIVVEGQVLHVKLEQEQKPQPVIPQHAVQPQAPAGRGAEPQEDREEGGAQEEERRRELAEEEMEQAGQPQRLEDSEQPQDEDVEEAEHDQPDENALDHDHRQVVKPQPVQEAQLPMQQEPAAQVKSAYEQQLEQQRLAEQMAEERRQLQLRQEALRKQRLQQHRERELQIRAQREREMEQHREADRKEQLLRQEQLRQKIQYENIDADIVQGEDDPQIEENEVRKPQDHLKEMEVNQEEVENGRQHKGNVAEADMNPEDDPNNQGEDEFEEAQDQRQEVQPPAGFRAVENPNRPAAAERDERAVAGNPDQQEDALDEQYQEEGEEEAQDELMPGQNGGVDVVEEDPYNDENGERGDVKRQGGPGKQDTDARKEGAANEDENYEEEEDEDEMVEEEGVNDKQANRRAEM